MLFSARKSREEQENPRKVQLFSNLLIRDHGCAPIEELRDPNLEFVSCSDWFRCVIISTEPIRAAYEFKIWVAQFLDRRTTMVTDKKIAKQLNFSRIFLFFTTLTSAK